MEPIINLEETPERIVGRRSAPAEGFVAGLQLQESAAAYAEAFGHKPLPKGVYRFNSHQEADEWMLRMLARHERS